MLELINVTKKYQIRKDKAQTVLENVNAQFSNTGFVSILGSSGNGKTTLLNVIGGLDDLDGGTIRFNGEEIQHFEAFRRERVGYVFQQFNLIEHLNAIDNVIVSMGDHVENKRDEAMRILIDMGLEECLFKLPKHLSGGQCQRIAIARMIAKDVDILICDEPTGSLDEETEKSIVTIIKEMSKDRLVLFVTHNRRIAEEYSDRIIIVHNGQLEEQNPMGEEVARNDKNHDRSYDKNSSWLSKKSIFGRMKFSFKYFLLTIFILSIASMSIILEGEFFKQYMHEISVDTGINNMMLDVAEDELDEKMEDLRGLDHVDHVTPYYRLMIGMAASNYVDTRQSSETRVENVTGNTYIKDNLIIGRFPESPDEILMTEEGAVILLRELNIGGERLYDQYLTGEMTAQAIFDLVEWREWIVVEYGMPRVKIVGLINDDRLYEEWHKVYYLDGFFDLFEYPGSVKSQHIKIYKDNLYQDAEDLIIDRVEGLEGIELNGSYSTMTGGVYSHIDSIIRLSKVTLLLILAIAGISFLSLLYTSLFERKYEIGLYRSLGYNKKNIHRVLAYEMLAIGMTALLVVVLMLIGFSVFVLTNLAYYDSFVEILDIFNILGIILSLVVIVTGFTASVVSSGHYLLLRKTVLANINEL